MKIVEVRAAQISQGDILTTPRLDDALKRVTKVHVEQNTVHVRAVGLYSGDEYTSRHMLHSKVYRLETA